LRLENLTVSWPTQPPGEDFQPKHKSGSLVRDPRKDFEPMPPMSLLWGRNLRRSVVALPQAESFRGAEPMRLDDCELL
jgi:hypothetical protein